MNQLLSKIENRSPFWAAVIKLGSLWFLALLIVLLLRFAHVIAPTAQIYTDWAITSGLVMALANSFFRETKNRDDRNAHSKNNREIAAVRELVKLLREEFGQFRSSVHEGMAPVDPSKLRKNGDIQNGN